MSQRVTHAGLALRTCRCAEGVRPADGTAARGHAGRVAAANMKELRFDAADGVWRFAFAFDPRSKAIMLCGGDKSGGSQKRLSAAHREGRCSIRCAPGSTAGSTTPARDEEGAEAMNNIARLRKGLSPERKRKVAARTRTLLRHRRLEPPAVQPEDVDALIAAIAPCGIWSMLTCRALVTVNADGQRVFTVLPKTARRPVLATTSQLRKSTPVSMSGIGTKLPMARRGGACHPQDISLRLGIHERGRVAQPNAQGQKVRCDGGALSACLLHPRRASARSSCSKADAIRSAWDLVRPKVCASSRQRETAAPTSPAIARACWGASPK